jgi:UDP-glucuronate 4-epimerase
VKILVTGAAGFIGFHAARALLDRGDEVLGVDNLSPYYDVRLKQDRLKQLEGRNGFQFVKADLADRTAMEALFSTERPNRVIHLGAQAGVRYSLENPHAYIESNITGFLNVLEGCRHNGVAHLVFASSSSVYGANTAMPFSVHQNVDHPISLYAATKKANELMAHSYATLYRLPVTGLRFFTVYGPWGRPDMALFVFVRKILADEPIDVFNKGRHARGFTYIDDIIEGVLRVVDRVPEPSQHWSGDHPDPGASSAPYKLYNIGSECPVRLMDFIACIEKELGREAKKNFLPLQPGDVPATYAEVEDLRNDLGFKPTIPFAEGVRRFVVWYRGYFQT